MKNREEKLAGIFYVRVNFHYANFLISSFLLEAAYKWDSQSNLRQHFSP